MANKSIINRFSTIATDPLRNFRFYAEFTQAGEAPFSSKIATSTSAKQPTSGISDGWIGGFTSISGLAISTQNIPYREGGYNTTVHQVPGMTTFVPVTFQRGALFGNDQAITWMKGLFSAAAGGGLATGAGKTFRVNIDIYVMDHPNASSEDNTPRMRFRIHNAWISNLNYNDLNAADGNILFETMTLVHEGLSVDFVGADGKPVA